MKLGMLKFIFMRRLIYIQFLMVCYTCLAISPDRLALLVNKQDQASLEVANHFVKLRQITPEQIIYLDVSHPYAPSMTSQEFTDNIWLPANQIIETRGLKSRILAWVYAPGFPATISTAPNISITGLTFTKNQIPEAKLIKQGLYPSPLFAGPDKPDGPARDTFSLDQYQGHLKDKMPLPSIALGYHGARGNRIKEMIDMLQRGKDADAHGFWGTFYFWTNGDVRSKCRAWQFPAVVEELRALNLLTYHGNATPPRNEPISGLMTGRAQVNTPAFSRMQAGVMAEHLTSFGAVFFGPGQTKCTEWIKAGATGTAGTITEPYAIWTKFPHARFYAHYAKGCTMLDSFYQALRCPLQLFIIGDPLTRPRAPKISLKITPERGNNTTTFFFRPSHVPKHLRPYYRIYLNGKLIALSTQNKEITIPDEQLILGHNELRVIIFTDGPIRYFDQTLFEWGFWPDEQKLAFTSPAKKSTVPLHRPLEISWGGARNRSILRLKKGLTVLGLCNPQEKDHLSIDPRLVGLGPSRLYLESISQEGRLIRSHPLHLNVAEINTPPKIKKVKKQKYSKNISQYFPVVTDPDGDDVQLSWHINPLPFAAKSSVFGKPSKIKSEILSIETTNTFDLVLFHPPPSLSLSEFSSRIAWKTQKGILNKELAYLVFNYDNEKNFYFFGMNGHKSAWVIGKRKLDKFIFVDTSGHPISRKTTYFLELKQDFGNGLVGLVDGQPVCFLPEGEIKGTRFGLLGGPKNQTIFTNPAFRITRDSSPWFREQLNGKLYVKHSLNIPYLNLTVRAFDGAEFKEKQISITGK